MTFLSSWALRHVWGVAGRKTLSTSGDGFPDNLSCHSLTPPVSSIPAASHSLSPSVTGDTPGRQPTHFPAQEEPRGERKGLLQGTLSRSWDPSPLPSVFFPAREKAHDRPPPGKSSISLLEVQMGKAPLVSRGRLPSYSLNNPGHSETREQGHSNAWARQ